MMGSLLSTLGCVLRSLDDGEGFTRFIQQLIASQASKDAKVVERCDALKHLCALLWDEEKLHIRHVAQLGIDA